MRKIFDFCILIGEANIPRRAAEKNKRKGLVRLCAAAWRGCFPIFLTFFTVARLAVLLQSKFEIQDSKFFSCVEIT
jgi:hypothetical protein